MDLVRIELFYVLSVSFGITLAIISLLGKSKRDTKVDWVSTNCKLK